MKTFLNFYKQHNLNPMNFLRNNIESPHPIPKSILDSIYNIFRQLKIQTLELSLWYKPNLGFYLDGIQQAAIFRHTLQQTSVFLAWTNIDYHDF